MKENYYDKAISFEHLYKGLKSACRNVRWKDSVIRYEAYGLRNTYLLRQALLDGTYEISPYQTFKVHEPKERFIYAPRLVDRQLQHALCDTGLYDDIAEHFIRDSMACQKGRGTDDALRRFKVHLRRYFNKYGIEGWVLKCDIHHFFPNTPHNTVKATARKYISDPQAANMVCRVVDSFDGEVGLGLGSQISQIMELLVLNDLDHFIKERLHIKYYIRYMDDFILIHPDKTYLQYCLREIEAKLTMLGLSLNRKTNIQPLHHGVMFLKWHYYILPTGRIIMKISKSKRAKQRHRLTKLYAREQKGLAAVGSTANSLISFLANAKRGNAYKLRREMRQFYHQLTGSELRERKLSKNKARRSTKCRDSAVS